VIYSPGEANSVAIVASLKKAAADAGMTVVEAAAARTVDVPTAAQSLVGKADVIYTPTDNNVVSAFEGIVKVAQQAKLPVVAADTATVERGAVAALGLNYSDIGRQTGKIVVRILKGEKPGTIASQTSTNFELVVNPGAAKAAGRDAVRIAAEDRQGRGHEVRSAASFAGSPHMSLIASLGAIEIGLIFGLVALGVFMSFRIINFPDLTVDGSFPLGAAVAATLIVLGWNPVAATAVACVAGAAAGWVTAWLNVKLKIMQLLASILVMIALYSINLRVMGKPNVALITEPTVFTMVDFGGMPEQWAKPLLLLLIVIVAKIVVDMFFASEAGLAMRATGGNARMARAQGISTDFHTMAGLALSNALVALAGALFAQSQGTADISMGVGTIVIGLAAVIIGETLLPARSMVITTLACVLGALLYRFFIAMALNTDFMGLQAQDLNLVTAVLVAVALLIPAYKRKLRGLFKGKN
jgi:putative ABC transport system permease protein